MERLENLSENIEYFKKLINLFDVSHMGLWEMHEDDSVIFYNQKFYESFNIPLKNSTLKDWTNLIHPDDQRNFDDNIEEHTTSHVESFKSEYRVYNKKGNIVWIEAQGIATFDEDGTMLWMVGSHTDITINKEYQEKLYQEAYMDDLTGFQNRKKLIHDIEEDLDHKNYGMILLIDYYQLNNYLTIYGQRFIDQLLYESSKILMSVQTPTMTFYRNTTSRFVIRSSERLIHSNITTLLQTLSIKLSGLKKNLDLPSEVMYKCAVISYPLKNESLSAEDIVNRLNITLEYTKLTSNADLNYYTEKTSKKVLRKLFMETNMQHSLKEGEFYPVFQPIVSSTSHQLMGFEALCRWHNLEWGDIYPDEFIGLAEKNNVIIQIGNFMLHCACAFIRNYNLRNKTDISVSVNASVIELYNSDYYEDIMKVLKYHRLKPSNLIIEITESLIFEKNTNILSQLERLKNEGIGIALDDFGTGYASINSMVSAPLTELKLDREIMLQLQESSMIFDFISSLVALCHKHNLIVVAEGIEDLDMEETSRGLNMDYLQGYLYSRPMTESDALEFSLD